MPNYSWTEVTAQPEWNDGTLENSEKKEILFDFLRETITEQVQVQGFVTEKDEALISDFLSNHSAVIDGVLNEEQALNLDKLAFESGRTIEEIEELSPFKNFSNAARNTLKSMLVGDIGISLFGNLLGDEDATQRAEEFKRQQDILLPTRGGPSEFLGTVTGSLIPSAAALAATVFPEAVSTATGIGVLAAFGASAAGSSVQEANITEILEGREISTDAKISAATGAAIAEIVFERFQLGRLGKITEGVAEGIGRAALTRNRGDFFKAVSGLLALEGVTEGGAEVATQIAQNASDLFFKPLDSPSQLLEGTPEAFLGGAIGGGALGGGAVILGSLMGARSSRAQVRDLLNNVLEQEGVAPGSEYQQQLDQVSDLPEGTETAQGSEESAFDVDRRVQEARIVDAGILAPNDPLIDDVLSDEIVDPEVLSKMTPEEKITLVQEPDLIGLFVSNDQNLEEIRVRKEPEVTEEGTILELSEFVDFEVASAIPFEQRVELLSNSEALENFVEKPESFVVGTPQEVVNASKTQSIPSTPVESASNSDFVQPVGQSKAEPVENTVDLEQEGQEGQEAKNFQSFDDFAEQQRAKDRAGFVRTTKRNEIEDLEESDLDVLKKRKGGRAMSEFLLKQANRFKFGKNRGGRSEVTNEAIIDSYFSMQALHKTLDRFNKSGRQELKDLFSKHGKSEVLTDLDNAFKKPAPEKDSGRKGRTKKKDDFSPFTFEEFTEKYELGGNSIIRQVGERLLSLGEAQQTLVDSKSLPESVKAALTKTGFTNAQGSPYEKTAYLRFIVGEKNFIDLVDPETFILAKNELKAGINRGLDTIEKAIRELKPKESLSKHLDQRLRSYGQFIENAESIFDDGKILRDHEAIENQVMDTLDYLLNYQREGTARTSGKGLPIPHIMHKHLEGAMKELYKPLNDPFEKALLTIDAVESLLLQSTMLDRILSESGEISEKGFPQPSKRLTVKLEGRKFGNLEGRYTTPENAKVLNGETVLPKTLQEVRQLYMNILGLERLSALIQIPTIGRNFFSSYFGFAMQSGDFFSPEYWREGLKGTKDLFTGLKNNEATAVQEFEKLVKFSILSSKSQTLLADMSSWTNENMVGKANKGMQKILDKAGGVYAAIDYPAKLQAYYGYRSRAIKRELESAGLKPFSLDSKLTKQQQSIVDKAEQEASEHVKKFYQYKFATPEIAESLSRSPFTDFIGYQFNSASIMYNGAVNAVKSLRGEGFNKGNKDWMPMVGFLAAHSISLTAFEFARRLLLDAVTKVFGSDLDEEDVFTDNQNNQLRKVLPAYWRSSNIGGFHDKDGNIAMVHFNTINPWSWAGMMAGAVQEGVEAGNISVAVGSLGKQFVETFSPNMFVQTFADFFFDADLNNMRAGQFEETLTALFFSSLSDMEMDPKLWDKLKEESLGFVSNVTPPDLLKTAGRIQREYEENLKAWHTEAEEEGVKFDVIKEELKKRTSIVRVHKINTEDIIRFGGRKKWAKVNGAKQDFSAIVTRAIDFGEFRPEDIRQADKRLKRVRDQLVNAADFIGATRDVNRQLTNDEIDNLFMDNDEGARMTRRFVKGGVATELRAYLNAKGVDFSEKNGEFFVEGLKGKAKDKAGQR